MSHKPDAVLMAVLFGVPNRDKEIEKIVEAMLPDMTKFCLRCGNSFDPGDSGFSHCKDHRGTE